MKSAGAAKVHRTAAQLKSLFSGLPDGFAFRAGPPLVDVTAEDAEEAARQAAKSCTSSGSLLLVYYFGHARRDKDDLLFVHPGARRDENSYLGFDTLIHTVMAGKPHRVLFLLDCCYAGASAKEFDLLPEFARKRCCLIGCTSASTRAFWEQHVDAPLGYFTLAMTYGLSGPGGTVSPGDDAITVDSLYRFIKQETHRSTHGLQQPYMLGTMDQELSRYSYRPQITKGISEDVSEKSAYCKILAIIRTIGRKRHEDLVHLYRLVRARYKKAFLTNFVDEEKRITQGVCSLSVVRRYVSFLRAIQVIDSDGLMLTVRGLDLLEDMNNSYNARLYGFLTRFLQSQYELSVDQLRQTMQRVMMKRWLPTKENVMNDLFLERGRAVNEQRLGLALDLLGYIGVIGTLRKRQQVYFPWNERPSRRGLGVSA
jgi:caspase domain-containing protein